MANYSNLKAAVAAAIKTNGNQEITGQVLQDVLTSIISVIGANYTFAGVATPSTNPGTPDQNVVYMASQAGTYTNFGGIELPAGISLLKWTGNWNAETLYKEENLKELFRYRGYQYYGCITGKIIKNTDTINFGNVEYTDYAQGLCTWCQCQVGQVFLIRGIGLTSARIWSFHDVNGNVISIAPAEYKGARDRRECVIAPKNAAYFVFNGLLDSSSYISLSGVWTNGLYDGHVFDINKEQEIPMLLGVKYTSFADAQPSADSLYKVIDINVNPNEKLLTENVSVNTLTRYLYFDANNNTIGNATYIHTGLTVLVVPNNAKKLRIQLLNNSNNKIYRKQFGGNDFKEAVLYGGFNNNIMSHIPLYNQVINEVQNNWRYTVPRQSKRCGTPLSNELIGKELYYETRDGYQISINVFGAYQQKESSGWLTGSGKYQIGTYTDFTDPVVYVTTKRVVNGSEVDIVPEDVKVKCRLMSVDAHDKEQLKILLKNNTYLIDTYLNKGKVVYSAHRGLRTIAPENSIPAYEEAGKAGFDFLNLAQLRQSADGTWYVMHDPTIDRTTDGTGAIKDLTDDYLQTVHIDVGPNIEQYSQEELVIPTLEKAIQIARKYGMKLYFRIASITGNSYQADKDAWDSFIAIIRKYRCEGMLFGGNALTDLLPLHRDLGLDWCINYDVYSSDAVYQQITDYINAGIKNATIFTTSEILTDAHIIAAREHGFKVMVHLMNDNATKEQCLEWSNKGVDIIGGVVNYDLGAD